ncbi:hypothetical protein P7K49_009928 [Saguinus oedipus]|uniref:Uncharacterized protein n=1 Tax=Saguinus oedipus TaxID=9490 RepID=A0ABQ9VPK4_SAGOE|nr:hypothetical protein P7K49_009928 [Saguinus oedipus]
MLIHSEDLIGYKYHICIPKEKNYCATAIEGKVGAFDCFRNPSTGSAMLAEDHGAANTQNYRLCLAEDRGDFIASWAFHIHEVGTGALHQGFLLAFPLLLFRRGMKEILCERHVLKKKISIQYLQAVIGVILGAKYSY